MMKGDMEHFECVISISGPGSVINNELAVVEQALKEVGYDVHVENSHPDSMSQEECLRWVKSLKIHSKIKIVMDHQPWGG